MSLRDVKIVDIREKIPEDNLTTDNVKNKSGKHPIFLILFFILNSFSSTFSF